MYTVFGTNLGNGHSRYTEKAEDKLFTENEIRNGVVTIGINLYMDNPNVTYIEVTGMEETKTKEMWSHVVKYVSEHVDEILGE